MLWRRALLATVVAGVGWAVVIALTGGVLIETPWGALSSRGPVRPLAIAALAGVAYVFWFARSWPEDAGRAAALRWPPLLAATFSVLALIIGIRLGTFVAGAADPSGYVSQAELWLRGNPIESTPGWAAGAPWANAEWTTMPLGYVPGPRPHTQVPMYAPGLPMTMALFQMVGGRDAVYYVVPLLGAVLVWTTYLIGARLAGPCAGAIASALMVSSPPFLVWLVMPMTDVPIAAWWSVAVVLALRQQSFLSGLATSAAILTRPNLAPLAAIVALIVLARSRQPRAMVPFVAGAVPGVIATAAINNYLYGSPLRSGYGMLQQIYAIDRVPSNIINYFGWLAATQTPVVALALAAPFVVAERSARLTGALVCIVFPLAAIALYLPYLVFEDWLSLRFILSAYPGLFAGVSLALVAAWRCWPRPATMAIAALIVAVLTLRGLAYSNTPADFSRSEARYRLVAEYVGTLPRTTVVVSRNHSGALRYYAGRDVLRWDIVEPGDIETAVAYLAGRGHDVLLIVDEEEVPLLRERFSASLILRQLDRPTRTMAETRVRIYRLATS
jgi:4-amino-4-deoxy-L-arabinose transferase-like glycosyltransferase